MEQQSCHQVQNCEVEMKEVEMKNESTLKWLFFQRSRSVIET